MNIGIGLKKSAYTPEAYAYSRYLVDRGFYVQLEQEAELDLNNDINIYFMGLRPFWRIHQGSALEIHEYHSLSTGRYPCAKNTLKKLANKKPSGRIYLNNFVRNDFNFTDKIPAILRDMGVDEKLFQEPVDNPEYDIVYAGSLDGRTGLLSEIIRLSEKGFKILVVGTISNLVLSTLKQKSNITLTGRVEREYLPELFRNCKAGLNYTPDIYPLNAQTSTKVLEYLASGLTLISNKYDWISSFCLQNDINPIWLNNIESVSDLEGHTTNKISLKEYSWDSILDKTRFVDFLNSVAAK